MQGPTPSVTNLLVVSRSLFPSESAFVLPQLSLGSCQFECFMFAGHEAYRDMHCIGVATCAKRAVSLRISRSLSHVIIFFRRFCSDIMFISNKILNTIHINFIDLANNNATMSKCNDNISNKYHKPFMRISNHMCRHLTTQSHHLPMSIYELG